MKVGTLRGKLRYGPLPLPPALETVAVARAARALAPVDLELGEGVQQFLAAYADAGGHSLLRLMSDAVYCAISQAVGMLVRARVSIKKFVKYVCAAFEKLRRRVPYPSEVFGRRAINGWMSQYLRHGRGMGDGPRYRQTVERRKLYMETICAYDRLLPLDG